MFKKPISDLKTSAPLRSSDRRKLKQRTAEKYGLSPDEGELLVPDGLKSVKFETHAGMPGVAYLAPNGDPLWFTLGKGSDELIPTVYTLWKKPDILPTITTPQAVIPKLQDGADLMIPGVVSHPIPLSPHQLVCISKHSVKINVRSYPIAVGKIEEGVTDAKLGEEGARGKAVVVWHCWKDGLWNLGHGGEVPEVVVIMEDITLDREDQGEEQESNGDAETQGSQTPSPSQQVSEAPQPDQEPELTTLTPEEITQTLHTALLLSLSTSSQPPGFPMPSTTFYTSHILPYRPYSTVSTTPVDIKHSTHKTLSSFLKSLEKSGLLTLKMQQQKGGNGTLVVTGVKTDHPEVLGFVRESGYRTMKEVEEREKKRREREEEEERKKSERVVEVREFWKPFGRTVDFFRGIGQDTSAVYSLTDLRALVNSYITSHNLVNPHQQQFINVSQDEALLSAITGPKGKGKSRELTDEQSQDALEFMKRDDVTKRLVDRMQGWYEVCVDGREGQRKKGSLVPITLTLKSRQGKRKAITLITGLEPFAEVVGSAEDVAEEVRKSGSGVSVSPTPNRTDMYEISVQGNQTKTIVDFLVGKGVPKRWVEVVDLTKK